MPTATGEKAQSLKTVFDSLHKLLLRHSPPFKVKTGLVRNKRDLHLIAPKPVAIPGAYGGKPTDKAVAAIIEQKGYIGFYCSPDYLKDGAAKGKSSDLMKFLKGKGCFHVTRLDASLEKEIEVALGEGTKVFESRGWL
ncbi:MAG TPA: hypothetical protein VNW47_00390 [Terriglobales bacterium]|jgi:hypothetical protein|nr:hypothetical protein [Terriglobales bacterium]